MNRLARWWAFLVLSVLVAPPLASASQVASAVRVCGGGDVMLGSNLDGQPAGRLRDPDSLLAPLAPLVADAQFVVLNVEGAIGEGAASQKCRPGSTACYAFRQPPAVAAALGRLLSPGRLVATVANNHAMDAGRQGFAATVRDLVEAGVAVTGADTLATMAVTEAGDSLAFLGFSTFQAGPDARDLPAVARYVARARERSARVVVTVHMGAEGAQAQRTGDSTELFLGENRGNPVAFARTAIEAGASVVFGHGPHVLRGAEWRAERVIWYSLGNLLTYGPFNMAEPRNRGALACVVLDEAGRVTAADLRATVQAAPGLVAPDPSHRAAFLIDSLSALDFPDTGVRIAPSGAASFVTPVRPRTSP